jgi:hypothetical protein
MTEEFVDPFKGKPKKQGPVRKAGPNDERMEMEEILEELPALGPLSDEENQAMEEMLSPPEIVKGAIAIADLEPGSSLELLQPNEVPVVGRHYVTFEGRPMPVLLGQYKRSEEDHVLRSASAVVGLKDPDGKRFERAKAYASWRYKGYLCGEVSGL